MRSSSIGDLAQSFLFQRRSVALRQDLNRLTDELSSGKVADVREVLAGNHNYLTSLERSLETFKGYSVANTEAGYLTAAMQASLERVQDAGGQLGLDLLLASGGPIGIVSGNPAQNARTQLENIVSSLNDDIAGLSLFAGTATNRTPLPSADVLIDRLRLAVAGETTPVGILNAAKTWFADPLGFDTEIYDGSSVALAPFSLSETEKIPLDVKVTDPAIKDLLMHTALASLADDPSLSLSVDAKLEFFRMTGIGLQSNQDQLTSLRSKIGLIQQRIEVISARNVAEETSIEFARNALLLADPFDTATALENVQFHLQSLYSVTVRSSQLSLVKFL